MGRHLARLRRSLAGLGIELDRSDDELRAAMEAVAGAIDGPAKVRLTVTAGPGPLGSGRDDARCTVYVAGDRLDPWPAAGAAITVPWRRNEHSAVAGLKTTSYAENVVALAAPRRTPAPPRRSSPTPPATSARAPVRTCSSSTTGWSARRRCRPAVWPASPGSCCSSAPTWPRCEKRGSRWTSSPPPTRCSSPRRPATSRASAGWTHDSSRPPARCTAALAAWFADLVGRRPRPVSSAP